MFFGSNLTPFTVDAGQDPVDVESITKTMGWMFVQKFSMIIDVSIDVSPPKRQGEILQNTVIILKKKLKWKAFHLRERKKISQPIVDDSLCI